MNCIICDRILNGDLADQNEDAVAILDSFPLNPGHILIVPRVHEANFLRLSKDQQQAIWRLVGPVKQLIEANHSPDGYNIGINIGSLAGQTIAHAHLHVIPRYKGDVEDPRGGIRWIIPARARYWKD